MASDKDGNSLEEYPSRIATADLIGLTSDGFAAYHQADIIFLAELRDDGEVNTPPDGFGLSHELDLSAFDWTLSDYIRETARDRGKWRALTPYASEQLDETVDREEVIEP